MIIKKFTNGIEIWRQERWGDLTVGQRLLTSNGMVVVDSIDGDEATVSYDVTSLPTIRYQRPMPTKD